MKLNKDTIMLVGGGTGGHFVPIFAAYQELKSLASSLNIVVVGSGNEMEKKYYLNDTNYYSISTGKFHRHQPLKNIRESMLFVLGLCQSLRTMIRFKPSVIFSKGGHVAMPIIIWAKFFDIPYLIHESDIEIGKTNLFAASRAKTIFTGFPIENYDKKFREKMIYTGQLLRPSLFDQAVGAIKFSSKKPVLFITGGSQGATNINKNVSPNIAGLLSRFNIIHQTGKSDYLESKKAESDGYKVFQFMGNDEMLDAIKLADIIVSRASATTIAEIAALGKPAILVPYKYAAADHQTKNAKILVADGAAIMIADDELTPRLFFETVTKIYEDKKLSLNMSEKIRKYFPDNGLKIVCDHILNLLKG